MRRVAPICAVAAVLLFAAAPAAARDRQPQPLSPKTGAQQAPAAATGADGHGRRPPQPWQPAQGDNQNLQAPSGVDPQSPAPSGDVSVTNGTGQLLAQMASGTMVAQVGSGQVLIRGARVGGAACRRHAGGYLCSGSNFSFSASGTAWTCQINGQAIDISLVGRGLLSVRGTDGYVQINGGAPQAWMLQLQTFRLN